MSSREIPAPTGVGVIRSALARIVERLWRAAARLVVPRRSVGELIPLPVRNDPVVRRRDSEA